MVARHTETGRHTVTQSQQKDFSIGPSLFEGRRVDRRAGRSMAHRASEPVVDESPSRQDQQQTQRGQPYQPAVPSAERPHNGWRLLHGLCS